MWQVGQRFLPAGIRIDGGSDWYGLTRELAQLATSTSDPLVAGLVEFSRRSIMSPESFFHVLLRNSRLCATFANRNLRMVNWRRKEGCLCQQRDVVGLFPVIYVIYIRFVLIVRSFSDWCGCSPMVFRASDLSHISKERDKYPDIFFARKFESALDISVMNRLEERFITDDPQVYPGWQNYWENAFHSDDVSPKQNPTLLAAAQGLVRLALSHLSDRQKLQESPTSSHCSLVQQPDKIVAITSFFSRDDHQVLKDSNYFCL